MWLNLKIVCDRLENVCLLILSLIKSNTKYIRFMNIVTLMWHVFAISVSVVPSSDGSLEECCCYAALQGGFGIIKCFTCIWPLKVKWLRAIKPHESHTCGMQSQQLSLWDREGVQVGNIRGISGSHETHRMSARDFHQWNQNDWNYCWVVGWK